MLMEVGNDNIGYDQRSDLFHYYEENIKSEYNENYEDDLYWESSISKYKVNFQVNICLSK